MDCVKYGVHMYMYIQRCLCTSEDVVLSDG